MIPGWTNCGTRCVCVQMREENKEKLFLEIEPCVYLFVCLSCECNTIMTPSCSRWIKLLMRRKDCWLKINGKQTENQQKEICN